MADAVVSVASTAAGPLTTPLALVRPSGQSISPIRNGGANYVELAAKSEQDATILSQSLNTLLAMRFAQKACDAILFPGVSDDFLPQRGRDLGGKWRFPAMPPYCQLAR